MVTLDPTHTVMWTGDLLIASLLVLVPLQPIPFTVVLIPWIATWRLLDRSGYGEPPRRLQPHVFDRWCVVDVQDFSRVPPVCEKLSSDNLLTYGGQTYTQHGNPSYTLRSIPINLALGCRHEFVRRPFSLSEASFGGSYDGDIAIVLNGNNSDRQTYWPSGIPPARDVEAIFGLICQLHDIYDFSCHANLYTRSHHDISRQNTHVIANTPTWLWVPLLANYALLKTLRRLSTLEMRTMETLIYMTVHKYKLWTCEV